MTKKPPRMPLQDDPFEWESHNRQRFKIGGYVGPTADEYLKELEASNIGPSADERARWSHLKQMEEAYGDGPAAVSQAHLVEQVEAAYRLGRKHGENKIPDLDDAADEARLDAFLDAAGLTNEVERLAVKDMHHAPATDGHRLDKHTARLRDALKELSDAEAALRKDGFSATFRGCESPNSYGDRDDARFSDPSFVLHTPRYLVGDPTPLEDDEEGG